MLVFYYTRFYHLVGSRQDLSHQPVGYEPQLGVWASVFPLSPASTRSITHPGIRSESTLEKPARQTKHRPLPCSCGPAPAFRAAALLHAALRTWLAAPFRPRRRAPALSALRVPAGRAEPGHARAPCLRAAVSTASVLGHLTAAVAHAPKTFSSSSEPWRPRLSAPPHPRPSRCGDLAPTATVG